MKLGRPISFLLAAVFLTSNFIWSGTQGLPQKLAAPPQTGRLAGIPYIDSLGQLLKANTTLRELGITDIQSLLMAKDILKEKGVIAFLRTDKLDASKSAKYIFIGEGLFIRVTPRGTVVDDDLRTLLRLHRDPEVKGDDNIEIYAVSIEMENAVNAVLQQIDPAWYVGAFVRIPVEVAVEVNGGTNRSHLFPKYIHDALEKELKKPEKGLPPQRIEHILTMGVVFYVTDRASIPPNYTIENDIAVDEDIIMIATQVLTTELQKNEDKKAKEDGRPPKTVKIKGEDVKTVLLQHEKLHRLIKERKINIPSVLDKLREHYDEQKVNSILCSFARNYNYLPNRGLDTQDINLTEDEKIRLVEELLVHTYIERYHLKQPVCLLPLHAPDLQRVDLDPDIEKIFFATIDPKIIVGLFSVLYNITDPLMENYFLLLFKSYLSDLEDLRLGKSGIKLSIGDTFFPSAMLEDHPELKGMLTAVEYGKDLADPDKRENYEEVARTTRVILNPMDGGVGSAVDDKAFLKERKIDGKDSSKGGNMPVNPGDNFDEEISIMEAKLLRALKQAGRGDYRFLQYQILGSKDSANSFIKILDKKCRMPDANGRTYSRYIKDNAGRFGLEEDEIVQIGMKIPVINKKLGWFFSEKNEFGHGNHGLRGVYFFQEAMGHKVAEGENVVRAIYNGDGINNGIAPAMVGYMVEERVPVIMVTTTKMPIDRKGGMIGIYIPKGGSPEVKIMERAQAKDPEQVSVFEDTGLKGKGKQYFNTNTVLMNIGILQPILNALLQSLGGDKDRFLRVMSPDLIINDKGDHIQIEGALGSVVLNLSNYIDSLNEDHPVKKIMRQLGVKGKFLHIVNVEEEHRARFFTPFKETSDYRFLFASGRFRFNEETWELDDLHPKKGIPRFQLANGFFQAGIDKPDFENWYKSIRRCFEAFGNISEKGHCTADAAGKRTDIRDLDSLEVPMYPVKFGNAKLEGRVVIFNMRREVYDLSQDDIRRELAGLAADKRINIGDNIRLSDSRLVLKDVCIVIGKDDEGPFISRITEKDGEIGTDYFARQIADIKIRAKKKGDDGKDTTPPLLLRKICEAMYIKKETGPLSRWMNNLQNDDDARGYVTPADDKYSSLGAAEPLDGISVLCKFEGRPAEKIIGIKKNIEEWQKSQERKRPLLAMLPDNMILLTVFNAVNKRDWERKYKEEIKDDLKDKIKDLALELRSKGKEEKDALKLAVYAVVTAGIMEVLEDFPVWKIPVFEPYRIALFPSDEDETRRSKLVLSMIAATPEDMAAVIRLRDAIREKTGIKDAVAFKRHVTLGYFVDTFRDLEEYNNFRSFVDIEMNRKMSRNFTGARISLLALELTCFKSMEDRRGMANSPWVKGLDETVAKNQNQIDKPETALSVIEGYLGRAPAPPPDKIPAVGPIGKTPEGGYSELVGIEVRDGKPGENRDIDDKAKTHPKYGKADRGMLDRVIAKLKSDKDYGQGILSVIDEIRIVDNIDVREGAELLPYAKIGRDEGTRTILFLDVDAFDNEDILYIELEHELGESIMKIVPYVSENIRELTANYMSLKFALKKGIRLDREKLREIGADLQFLLALEVLQEMGEVTDEQIIAVALEHMRAMPYYVELFRGFPFAPEWQDQAAKIQDTAKRYRAAIGIFNSIARAKEAAGTVIETSRLAINVRRTFTGLKVDGLERMPLKLAEMIGALAEQIGNEERYAALITKSDKKKYILVNNDKLQRLIEAMGDKDYSTLKDNLKENNYEICTEIPPEARPEDTARLVDPGDLEDMPQVDGMFYLPMPYTRSALYMTALILEAKGNLSEIPLVKQSLGNLYEGFTDEELLKLITTPWLILPKIQSVIAEIENLRRAVSIIEKAA